MKSGSSSIPSTVLVPSRTS